MAEGDDDPTAPADQLSSTPGNPHFIGRLAPTTHNMLPALRQTAYPARQMILDFVDLALARAKARKRKEDVSAALKANAERLKSAIQTFADLGEDHQHELVAVMWAGFHVGKNYPGLAADLKKTHRGSKETRRGAG
jgi:hypothetical protein